MPYPDLQEEVTNDPLGRGYSSMDAQAVVDDLQTEYRTVLEPINSRTLLRKTAELGILVPIQEEAETGNANVQNAALAAVKMTNRADIDLDLNDPSEEAQVDALVDAGVIQQADKDALIEEAETPVSRADELRREGKRLPSPIVAQHIETIRQ